MSQAKGKNTSSKKHKSAQKQTADKCKSRTVKSDLGQLLASKNSSTKVSGSVSQIKNQKTLEFPVMKHASANGDSKPLCETDSNMPIVNRPQFSCSVDGYAEEHKVISRADCDNSVNTRVIRGYICGVIGTIQSGIYGQQVYFKQMQLPTSGKKRKTKTTENQITHVNVTKTMGGACNDVDDDLFADDTFPDCGTSNFDDIDCDDDLEEDEDDEDEDGQGYDECDQRRKRVSDLKGFIVDGDEEDENFNNDEDSASSSDDDYHYESDLEKKGKRRRHEKTDSRSASSESEDMAGSDDSVDKKCIRKGCSDSDSAETYGEIKRKRTSKESAPNGVIFADGNASKKPKRKVPTEMPVDVDCVNGSGIDDDDDDDDILGEITNCDLEVAAKFSYTFMAHSQSPADLKKIFLVPPHSKENEHVKETPLSCISQVQTHQHRVRFAEDDKLVRHATCDDVKLEPSTRATEVQCDEDSDPIKISGRFPTTCPLVIMDIEVDVKTNRTLRVLNFYRTWTPPLTRRKLMSGLEKLNLYAYSNVFASKCFQAAGGRVSDPLTQEALRRVTDHRYSWMCAGAANEDWEMQVCSAIGIGTYEAICKRKQYSECLKSMLVENAHYILFAEEKMTNMSLQTSLKNVSYQDFLHIPGLREYKYDYRVLFGSWVLYRMMQKRFENYGNSLVYLNRVREDDITVPERLKEISENALGKPENGENRLTHGTLLSKCITLLVHTITCAISLGIYLVGDTSIPEVIGLRSCVQIEKTLSEHVACMLLKKNTRTNGQFYMKDGHLECLSETREDIKDVLKSIDENMLTVVVGHEETAAFVYHPLRKLLRLNAEASMSSSSSAHPVVSENSINDSICIFSFNPHNKYMPSHPHTDIVAATRQLRNPSTKILLITDTQYAGYIALANIMASVPKNCKVVIVGDDCHVPPPPKKPDFGSPFAAFCSTETLAKVRRYVSAHISKSVIEDCVSSMITDARDIKITAPSTPSVFVGSHTKGLELLTKCGADVIFTSSTRTKLEIQGDRVMCKIIKRFNPEADTNVFSYGDFVLVKSGCKAIAAGKLLSVETGGDRVMSQIKQLKQPIQRSMQYSSVSCPSEFAAGRKSKALPPVVTYATTEIMVKLSNSQNCEVLTQDTFPFEHLFVSVCRTTPTLSVPRVAFVIDSQTTFTDLMCASRMAQETIVFIEGYNNNGKTFLQASLKKRDADSILDHVLRAIMSTHTNEL